MRFREKIGVLGLSLALVSCAQPSSNGTGAEKAAASSKVAASVAQEPDGGSPERLRILSSEQYVNTLSHVFGASVLQETNFAPLPRTDGLLAIGASVAGISAGQVEQYQRIAAGVAARAVDTRHREFLLTCKPADARASDAACATEFFSRIGRLLYRRPLNDALLKDAVNKAGEGADRLKDFYAGLAYSLEGMLLSPQVLLVADVSEPDPAAPGRQRLDSYSLATRLSLFLWNAAPNDDVLKAAESGEIQTEKGRARIVDMMLANSRLEDGVRAFFDDMLGFDHFAGLAKDPVIYPAFTGATAADAREQTLRTVVDHLLTKKRDYRDLYTTRDTFLSPTLGALYGVAAPAWTAYTAPADSPRAGLITQISFLTLHAHPGRSSPTLRGKALRELLLCQPVPPPPANVDFSALSNPDPKIKTQRERVAFHLENPVCAGCHRITDPIGLALENFDGSGQYRLTEGGAPIDASGALDGKQFSSPVQLGAALHDHPALTSCLVRRVYGYATGTARTNSDAALLTYFNERFAQQGYRVPDLMRTVALSRAFATVKVAAQKTASLSPATVSVP